jgi:UDP-N-acetylmuramoylalanine--D-glutamate ligase
VVLIGTDTSALAGALSRHAPDVPVIQPAAGDTEQVQTAATDGIQAGSPLAGTPVMARAVASAAQLAGSGDTVLMAPAAASMDQFSSYAHRGDTFIEAVRELVEGQAQTGEE